MKFNSMYNSDPVVKRSQSLSCDLEDVYTEIPPYAVDTVSGQFLNKSSEPILKKTGVINVFERIQSYKDECDIYKILEKYALTGDNSFINQRVGSFGDFCSLPDNINDFNNLMSRYLNELKSVDKDVASMILNDSISTDAIVSLIDERIKANLLKEGNTNE